MNEVVDPFSPPTIEAVLSMIDRYARDNKMTPAELVDLFNTGIAVRQIALGAAGDSKPAVREPAHA